MTLDEAIKALEAARKVSGGDAWLAVCIPGKNGWTSRLVGLTGPCKLEADYERRDAYVVVARPEDEG